MPTEQILNSFVINQVDTTDTLDAMDAAGLVNPNELYLVEEGDFNMVLDEQPTEGSRNLVTSGGIYQAIQSIPTPDVSGQIQQHNEDASAHPAIRQAVTNAANAASNAQGTANEAKTAAQNAQNSADSKVPNTRKVNGKALSADITLSASDVGAATTSAVEAAQTTANEAKTAVNNKASTVTYTVSVPASWTTNSAGGYMQTVTVSGILTTDNPIADVILGADVDANALYIEAWSRVTRITTAANSITLYANGDAPETAFTIQLKAVR